MPWIRQLFADLSPWSPSFALGSVHVEFMLDIVSLEQVFLRVPLVSPLNTIPPWLYSNVIWGWTTGLLLDAIQRQSLTPSTRTTWTTNRACSQSSSVRFASSQALYAKSVLRVRTSRSCAARIRKRGNWSSDDALRKYRPVPTAQQTNILTVLHSDLFVSKITFHARFRQIQTYIWVTRAPCPPHPNIVD
jgi:hypothetical protein